MLSSEAKKKKIQELCWELALLEEQIGSAVEAAKLLEVECRMVRSKVGRLSQLLKTLLCSISSVQSQTSLYLRPVNTIVSALKGNFELALATVSKCKRRSLLRRLFTGCNANHFRHLFHCLDASIGDMEWLVTVYNPQTIAIGGMASRKCPKFLVWSCIATIQMGYQLGDRVGAAKFLALLAEEKDEYKEIIHEEGGVPPLQKLLKESFSLDAQMAAVKALCLLATNEERTRIIMKEMISTIVNCLSRTSPVNDQIQAANLVASIAEKYPEVKEYHLMRENVIWRLVTLLSSEPSANDPRKNLLSMLKISCSKALWILARGSVSNCRTLTETKGLLCLAKLVETEQDKLQYNCLMILREITSIAESNHEFRHSAFKTSSPAAKAAVDQLLRVIKEVDDKSLRIPAIKSIGSLARTFSAKDNRVISPLVPWLGNADQEVAMEASIALEKFVCPDNDVSMEHSKSIIEFNGIPLLMDLIAEETKLQQHGLTLICYLAKHDINSNALIEAGALRALETTGRAVAAENSELEALVSNAISKLQSNQRDKDEESDSSSQVSIKQMIAKQWEAVSNAVIGGSMKMLNEITGSPQKLASSIQSSCESLSLLMRCNKRRIIRGLPIPTIKTRPILPLLKNKFLPLALRSVMDYQRGRLAMKEVVKRIWLISNVINQTAKKVIRKKFGFIIHKFHENVKFKFQ